MGSCQTCGGGLQGRQRKFCSRRCKTIHFNLLHQSYLAQQRRGRLRKLKLIALKGARCQRCGYGRNYAALEFHHPDPAEKEFSLDLRSLSNRKWEVVVEEARKCELLCSNCHAEIHNPECLLTSMGR